METVFNCNAQPIDKKMSSAEMTQLYKENLADGKQNGYTPIIVFVEKILEEMLEKNFKNAENEDAYVKSVLSNDHSNGKEWLDRSYANLYKKFGGEFLTIDEGYLNERLSRSKPSKANTFIPSASSFDGNVYLIQVPVTAPYEVFAYLPFCGWNDCPNVDDMISVCKYWYEEYGAIPTTINYDTLTFYLETPVSDKDTAVKAGKEHCAFCSEGIVLAGMVSYIDAVYNSFAWNFQWG